jgi:GT2 family glycosyltransferase
MTILHAGIIMGMGDHGVAGYAHHGLNHGNRGYFGRAGLVSEFSAVTGACMVFSRACFDDIDGMDEENLHNGYFDVDFGLRLSETGYQNLFTPFSTLIYHGNTGQGFNAIFNNTDASAAEIAFMKARWPKMIQHDPAYNPNLALEHPHFSLKWPLTDI